MNRTRHLEALCDLEVGRAVIVKGQRFFATDADAAYLNQKRPRVRDVTEDAAPVADPPPVSTAITPVAAAAPPTEPEQASAEDDIAGDPMQYQTRHLEAEPSPARVKRTPRTPTPAKAPVKRGRPRKAAGK